MEEISVEVPLDKILAADKPWKASPDEPYGIRRFNGNRSEDTQAFKDIDRHPRALEFLIPPRPSSRKKLDWLVRINEADEKDPRLMFAIVDDKNEPVGFIQFYPDKAIEKLRDQVDIPKDALVLEVAYGKRFVDWPKGKWWLRDRDNLPTEEAKGVAISGLKQMLIKIEQMEKTVLAGPIFITAYTNPENLASEGVLRQNNFTKLEQQMDYGKEKDNVWIKKIT